MLNKERERIAKYIQIINNYIKYLTKYSNDADKILTIFNNTKEKLNMMYISI